MGRYETVLFWKQTGGGVVEKDVSCMGRTVLLWDALPWVVLSQIVFSCRETLCSSTQNAPYLCQMF
jgi:hypothetical protein